MDYFGSFSQKGIYRFKIDQVPTSNQFDEEYWKNLRSVTNKNVSYSGHFQDFCTFSWDETKKKGNNFIFIYLPTPFQDFNSFWKRKIKIDWWNYWNNRWLCSLCCFINNYNYMLG